MDERKISSPSSTKGKNDTKKEEELEIDPSLAVDYDDLEDDDDDVEDVL